MQPLNTTARPSCSSTIGCAAASDRSMIDNRRWPSDTHPADHDPVPSGPRASMVPVIRATAPGSSGSPSSTTTSPEIPHMIHLAHCPGPRPVEWNPIYPRADGSKVARLTRPPGAVALVGHHRGYRPALHLAGDHYPARHGVTDGPGS